MTVSNLMLCAALALIVSVVVLVSTNAPTTDVSASGMFTSPAYQHN